MFNLIWADLFKLRRLAAMKIIVGIAILCALAMAFIAYLIPQGKLSENMTGIGFLFSDINIMSILGGALAGILICGDFDNKIIHDAIASGFARSTVIINKAIIFFIALTLTIFPYVLITGITISSGKVFSMGSVALGFLHLLTVEAGKTIALLAVGKLVLIIITFILVYMAQLSICIPLALLSKKPVVVVAVYYSFTLLCAQLVGIEKSSGLLNFILSLTPYESKYALLTLDSSVFDIVKANIISILFIIIMVAFTCFVFRKAEIK